jgi:hypothetical protein
MSPSVRAIQEQLEAEHRLHDSIDDQYEELNRAGQGKLIAPTASRPARSLTSSRSQLGEDLTSSRTSVASRIDTPILTDSRRQVASPHPGAPSRPKTSSAQSLSASVPVIPNLITRDQSTLAEPPRRTGQRKK